MAVILILDDDRRYEIVPHGEALPLTIREGCIGFASVAPNGTVTLTESVASNPAVWLFTPLPSEGDTK